MAHEKEQERRKLGVDISYTWGDRFPTVANAETGDRISGITHFVIDQDGGESFPSVTIDVILNSVQLRDVPADVGFDIDALDFLRGSVPSGNEPNERKLNRQCTNCGQRWPNESLITVLGSEVCVPCRDAYRRELRQLDDQPTTPYGGTR